ncbi:response regulator transcription factor [uncultured Draconibacterium sp.]|uniref:response regulator transcription factor n=1 Tax=uncultured Draconibacterium sp. TaxID=1573823 RepID=UPI003216BD9C
MLIGYDQQLIADGVAAILTLEKDLNVIACIKNDQSVLQSIQKYNPEIAILEIARWPRHYIDYIRKFSAILKNTKLLIISELLSHDALVEVMSMVNGYLIRTCRGEKIIEAIHALMKSDKYLCSQEIEEFVHNFPENKNHSLTRREKEILSIWLTSNENSEIADRLNISESTVRTHLKNIRQKSGSLNRIEMMVYACKNNVTDFEMEPVCNNCKFCCEKI